MLARLLTVRLGTNIIPGYIRFNSNSARPLGTPDNDRLFAATPDGSDYARLQARWVLVMPPGVPPPTTTTGNLVVTAGTLTVQR